LLRTAGQYHLQGNWSAAEQLYRQILLADPQVAEAWHYLGILIAQRGQPELALDYLRKGIALDPRAGTAWGTLGKVLSSLRRWDEACHAFREAVRLQPGSAFPLSDLASGLLEIGLLEEAETVVRQALTIDPETPEAQGNLGNLLMQRRQFGEALQWLRQAARKLSHQPALCSMQGQCLLEQGRIVEAMASFEQVLQLDPLLASAHMQRAVCRLLLGDYANGWPEYEWRWKTMEKEKPQYAQPEWDGTPHPQRTLLLIPEQGVGDVLQMVRYAATVRSRVGKLLVGCHASLGRLLEQCDAIDQVIVEGKLVPEFDLQLHLMSLPRVLGTTPETIPWPGPYLRASDADVDFWRDRLPGRFKVGICWQGNPEHKRDRSRSIPFEFFRRLVRPEVTFYSLQVGAGREHLDRSLPIVDLADELRDFADTAAVVAHLDLVITCDTSLAHLTGGMGKPVWLPLSVSPDWRWMLGREDSPWYPTMRLFRQTVVDDWRDVFERIANELARSPRLGFEAVERGIRG